MDQNKGELLCRVRKRVSALSLEHKGGMCELKKLKRVLQFLTGEEANRAGGRTHSVREVSRSSSFVLFGPPISCRHRCASDSLLAFRLKIPPLETNIRRVKWQLWL